MEFKDLVRFRDGLVEVPEDPTARVRYNRQQKQAKAILMCFSRTESVDARKAERRSSRHVVSSEKRVHKTVISS